MHYLFIVLYSVLFLLVLYLILGKLIPFFIFPNYFLKADIEDYKDIKDIAKKIKKKTKEETLKNIYKFMKSNFVGHPEEFKLKNALTLLEFGRYSTNNIIKNYNQKIKSFQWCHTQNRIIKSILINTKQFKEEDIKIRWKIINDPFIHQYLEINISNKLNNNKSIYKVDPFYSIFEKI